MKQWLAANGINEKTYYYWLRRVHREVYSQLNKGLTFASGQDRPSVSFAEITMNYDSGHFPVDKKPRIDIIKST